MWCLSYGGACVFFFFQAEDGIRVLVLSRGLGDVYKRQVLISRLSKKLLNYYATFTETKFNFSRLITYRWSDDE